MQSLTRRQFVALSAGTLAAGAFATAAGGGLGIDERAIVDATRRGDRAKVSRLLDEEPSLIAATDSDGRSLFAIALLGRHGDIAEDLRARGFEPDLHEAALALDWERFEALASEAPGRVNDMHPIGGSAMVCAAIGGAGSDMWRVYAQYGDPHVLARNGSSVVAAALSHPDLGTAEMTAATLLGNSADPRVVNADGSTLLHLSAARGSEDISEMLIRKGVDVKARDGKGRTALEVAEAHGKTRVAAMIDGHARIARESIATRRTQRANGEAYHPPQLSDLTIAERSSVVGSSHRNLAGVKDAVSRESRLAHSVATTGEGAVEAGAHMGNQEIVSFLLDHGAPCDMATIVVRGDMQGAKRRIREAPEVVRERGAHDFALLWYPVIGRTGTDMMELLLDAGAEVEQQHYLGTTALHFAAMRGDREMAELLLQRGANPNRVGRKFSAQGHTPLQLAERSSDDAMVEFLRERGAR